MDNKNWFNPAVSFDWINSMVDGVKTKKAKITASTVCVVLMINCAFRMNKSTKGFVIPHKLMKEFRVSRHTVNTTLSNLEKAGLVQLEKGRGKSIKIHLLMIPVDLVRKNYDNINKKIMDTPPRS